ncbi:MAG: MBL fold metallo-hydrolase [Candidatus Magasanikbacteria bacterium]|nr:MBL fold metallo-hydrolase [Candidatus Magasanikbacteria bacterium]
MLKDLMRAPYFPVQFATVQHRFKCHGLENIGTQVLVVHPEGGFLLVPVHIFEAADSFGKQLTFTGKGRFSIKECLVIRMHKTAHPENTVSYRFEERPTGRIFVFLTDHEKTAGLPSALKRHLTGAHLLVGDAQYSEERYARETAGYGHGTPEYCVDTALAAGVHTLGLTHHDPGATDRDVAERLAEAMQHAEAKGKPDFAEHVFACADYMAVEV